jgi:hypothetical protein
MVVLSCDAPGCEAEATESEWFASVPEAVEGAKRHGWVRITRNGRMQDLCPDHRGVVTDDPPASAVSPKPWPMPAELRQLLLAYLPERPRMTIIPRNRNEGWSSAHSADHYEIAAEYLGRAESLLTDLEKALADYPGVYLTTQIAHGHGPVNPAWPVRYRSPEGLRSQVCALWRFVGSPPQAESESISHYTSG